MDAPEGAPRGPVLALASDLLFTARIRATAQAVGVTAYLCRQPAELYERVRDGDVGLVLVDLDARVWDPIAVIGALVSEYEVPAARITAFVSHVRADAIAAARAAGAGRVMARSAFVRDLADLLRSAG